MRQGVRGPPRAGKLWAADCRLRCWLVTKLCSFRTAVYSGYLEQLCTALVCRKAFSLGLLSFPQFQSYYTDSKLLRREFFALPFAHTCATLPCGAFCACGSGKLSTGEEGGHKSAHSAGSNSGTRTPRSLKIFSRSLAALWLSNSLSV